MSRTTTEVPRWWNRVAASVLVGLVAISWLAGCSADPSGDREVLATIDGEPVRMAELDELVADQLAQMDRQYRRERQQLIEAGLDRVIRDRLVEAEAAKRGISSEELMAAQTGEVQVTDEEIAIWYQRNQAALGGRSLEELYPRIRDFLEENARQQALNEFAARLQEGREVVILLEPLRVDLNNEGSPALGPDDAPVTLVEFSDFECPYCGSFFTTLKRLEENYGDQLRVVYRQYPLETHPNAFKAAEASLCAHEQGRFWEMHDLMFTEQDRLDVESLKQKADRLGLDREEFDACLDSGRYAEQIRRDAREGDRIGIGGTPAIFVNGIPLQGGAVPYEVAAEVIDEELRRAAR